MFILMLTSKDLIKEIEVAFELGADSYVTKPFEMDRLLLKIDNLFKKK